MKVIERFGAKMGGVDASAKIGLAEYATEGADDYEPIRFVSTPDTQESTFTRDDFLSTLQAASKNPELFSQRVSVESTREDWDTPEEAEAWRHLQEEQ